MAHQWLCQPPSEDLAVLVQGAKETIWLDIILLSWALLREAFRPSAALLLLYLPTSTPLFSSSCIFLPTGPALCLVYLQEQARFHVPTQSMESPFSAEKSI